MLKKRKSLFTVFALILAMTSVMLFSVGNANTVMMPYLQAVTTNSIYTLVECDSTATAYADYGLTTSYGSTVTTESTEGTTAVPATYVHNIKLTGLSANTVYHYRVRQGTSTSADYTFRTAVNAGTSFRFGIMSDCKGGTTTHNTISGRIDAANTYFNVYAGDLWNIPDYAIAKSEFFNLANEKNLDACVPFFNATGNHEEWNSLTQALTHAPASSSGTQGYYSFDYGDIHFVIINNELTYTSGSVQYNWIHDRPCQYYKNLEDCSRTQTGLQFRYCTW